MTTANLSEMTPAEIDAELFPMLARRWQVSEWAATDRRYLAVTLFGGELFTGTGKYRSRVRRLSTPGEVVRFAESLAKYEEQLAEIQAQIDPINAEWDRRGGWTRYDVVRGGHLHKGGCHTLRWDTQRCLIAESSGLDADEVVARYTYTACTHCFPDAPVATPSTDPTACPGSGAYVPDANMRLYSPRGRCPECGQGVSVTSLGNARKHKVAA